MTEGTGGYAIAAPPGLKTWDMGKLGDQLKLCGELERKWQCCASNIESFTQYVVAGSPEIMLEIMAQSHPAEFDADLVMELLQRQATRYKTALEIAKTSYCTITKLAEDQEVACPDEIEP